MARGRETADLLGAIPRISSVAFAAGKPDPALVCYFVALLRADQVTRAAEAQTQEAPQVRGLLRNGSDGTRTRDLRRDSRK
jgi:hypothetical protein